MSQQGMTLKQCAKRRFFDLSEAYREAKQHMDTQEGREAFIILSVQLHSAKCTVPKSLWRLAK